MIKTVSLETAKKLKEAGFRKDTYFFWNLDLELNWYIQPVQGLFKSPTTDELLEELHTAHITLGNLMFKKVIRKKVIKYQCQYGNQDQSPFFENESLHEALASMWLWLKAEGLLKGDGE